MRLSLSRIWVVLGLVGAWPGAALGQASLHEQIDQGIAAGKADFARQASSPASDAEFLRRIYLDLTGIIPSADEARTFFKDPTPSKRARIIDQLLASPAYARHMQNVFDVLLLERRPEKHVKRAEWREYLRSSFAANKPYDRLVGELLSTDGAEPKSRAAGRFYLDRDGEPNVLTKDVSRLFLGMNLQCAQCHDHPLVEAYKQDHYYGIYAFLSRTFVFTDKAKRMAMLAEKAEGEVSFQSVFVPKVSRNTGPRLPDGPALTEPKLDKGKEYVVAPAKDVRPIPKYSRRSLLAGQVTASQRFRRSAANRLWFLMLGRGFVHPVDFDHEANPPSHPELLKLLADDIALRKFDVKSFLREIALSQTYQRASELPKGVKEVPETSFAAALLRPLSPEQMTWSIMQATGLINVERNALGKNTTEPALYARLAGNETPFVTLFGGHAGEPADLGFQATLDQTLFLNNGAVVRGWLAPRPGNLTFRLANLKDAQAVAEELYLSVLTRYPTTEEGKEVAEYLARHTADGTAALRGLAWALLASAEFRFNH